MARYGPRMRSRSIRSPWTAIEKAYSTEVGRNTTRLTAFVRGELRRAAESIAATTTPQVTILTGCFVPIGDVHAAETDGPIGAAILAAGLIGAHIPAGIVTDPRCTHAMTVAAEAASDLDIPVGTFPDSGRRPEDVNWNSTQASTNFSITSSTHVISIERLGPATDGRIRSMHGEDRTDVTGPLHELFERQLWNRIGIGDGGNEIGMGNLPHSLVADEIQLGSEIHCRVTCDELIVAGCANWGAFGLLAALAIALPQVKKDLLDPLRPDVHRRILTALLERGPSVDGISGNPQRSVDGIPEIDHESLIQTIRNLVEGLN